MESQNYIINASLTQEYSQNIYNCNNKWKWRKLKKIILKNYLQFLDYKRKWLFNDYSFIISKEFNSSFQDMIIKLKNAGIIFNSNKLLIQ